MLDRGILMLERLVAPKTETEARLRVEQVRAAAQNFLSAWIVNPILAVLVGAIALQWAGAWWVLPWVAAIFATVALAVINSRRIVSEAPDPAKAARLTLRLLAGNMPFMAAWPSIVVLAWVHGNPYNNAFFVAFMFASMSSGVAVSAPCRSLIVCNALVDLPILATHAIASGPLMMWLVPVLQLVGGAVIYDLSFAHHKLFRSTVLQRFENNDLVDRLTQSETHLKLALYDAQQANHAKSAFLAGMSHELRTPLNAIIGFSDLVLQNTFGPLSPARYGGYIVDIHNSGKHLLGLINNILDIAKIESGSRNFDDRELNITALAQDALTFVEIQAEKNGVSLHTDIDDSVGLVADERAVIQVLTNLLSNAVKFTKTGGRVTLFSRRIAGGIAIGVEDTGVGMSEADIARALEPYGQASDAMTVEGHGTGLGLSIVQTLLEAQEGSFHIVSEPARGTRAWAQFPLKRVFSIGKAA